MIVLGTIVLSSTLSSSTKKGDADKKLSERQSRWEMGSPTYWKYTQVAEEISLEN